MIRLAVHPDMIEGTRLFEASQFWDAHEAWERVWIAEKNGERRRFIQGLIQLAAALHKLLVMNNAVNALAIARRAREKLAGLADAFEGYDLRMIREDLDALVAGMERGAALRIPRIARAPAS